MEGSAVAPCRDSICVCDHVLPAPRARAVPAGLTPPGCPHPAALPARHSAVSCSAVSPSLGGLPRLPRTRFSRSCGPRAGTVLNETPRGRGVSSGTPVKRGRSQKPARRRRRRAGRDLPWGEQAAPLVAGEMGSSDSSGRALGAAGGGTPTQKPLAGNPTGLITLPAPSLVRF